MGGQGPWCQEMNSKFKHIHGYCASETCRMYTHVIIHAVLNFLFKH